MKGYPGMTGALILIFFLSACGAAGPATGGGKTLQSDVQRDLSPQVGGEDVQTLAAGNNAFALDLYQALKGEGDNLIYSPYSISLALAMTYAGAAGDTAAQMAQTLHFDLPPERLHPAFNALDLQLMQQQKSDPKDAQPFQLSLANSLWPQQDDVFLPAFLDLLGRNYGAGLYPLDYRNQPEAARQQINQWVSQQTKEKIKDLIPQGQIAPDTRLVLTNAIYFKADWLQPFAKESTRDFPFQRLDGSQVNAPLMSFEHPQSLPYLAGPGFQAVELPYVGEQVAMLILVPDAGNFEAFESNLNAATIADISRNLDARTVALALPKFQFTSQFSLKDALTALGMRDAFNDGAADFSGMTGQRDLVISAVLHKAFVAVDEKGTEAAAATAVVMKELALMLPDISLVVDRPFIFAILDKPSGALLFVGRVLDPTQK